MATVTKVKLLDNCGNVPKGYEIQVIRDYGKPDYNGVIKALKEAGFKPGTFARFEIVR